jgi:hypothetical protein
VISKPAESEFTNFILLLIMKPNKYTVMAATLRIFVSS